MIFYKADMRQPAFKLRRDLLKPLTFKLQQNRFAHPALHLYCCLVESSRVLQNQ